jgi:outer membrane phospholipase A
MKSSRFAHRCFFLVLCACVVPSRGQDVDGPADWDATSVESSTYPFADSEPAIAATQFDWSEPSSLVPGPQTSSEEPAAVELLDDGQNPPITDSTEPATRPIGPAVTSSNSLLDPDHYGIVQFFRHFRPFEPMYFVGGWQAPNIKFQFSVRYQIYTTTGTSNPTNAQRFWEGFNVAYSQTSLWDVSNSSEPFFYDSSYRPELFYELDRFPKGWFSDNCDFNIQVGLGHESNGLLPPDHRSMNIAFIHPTLRIGQLLHSASEEYFLTISPKIYGYIDDISQNPDIAKYRGYCDLRLVFGQEGGWQLATIARVGNEFDRGSAQIDFTYPLGRIFHDNDKKTDLCIDLQYFIGYGDTLLTYNQRSSVFRLGLSLYRY